MLGNRNLPEDCEGSETGPVSGASVVAGAAPCSAAGGFPSAATAGFSGVGLLLDEEAVGFALLGEFFCVNMES